MDRRVLKIGNFVQDAKNQGYAIRVGISEMHYTELFEPIKLTDEFFLSNEFKVQEFNGEKNYYRFRYIGKLTAIHEVQNALSECHIYWKIKA